MKKNCRTCHWSAWTLTRNGRRMYGAAAQCTYPVEVPKLPLARQVGFYYRADAIKKSLTGPVSVASYEDKELDCETWKAREKTK